MLKGQTDYPRHMDRDAYSMFFRGLLLMLLGVLFSVLALVFVPRLDGVAQIVFVLTGVGVLVIVACWNVSSGSGSSRLNRENGEAVG